MTGKVSDTAKAVESPLEILRKPFPANQVSKLPKETKAQIDQRKADMNTAFKCPTCGGWHHKKAVHLDYVGHAALTDRLLDADIRWSWEPLAFDEDGLPKFDKVGGLWIKLTVDEMTRLGYGSADGKQGGDAIKEVIGDAMRNAAMRFGAALDLWHKGDLHADDDAAVEEAPPARDRPAQTQTSGAKAETVADPPEGWGDYSRALIVKIAGTTKEDALDVLLDSVRRQAIAIKAHDVAMFNAIDKAFRDRRAILNDEVPV